MAAITARFGIVLLPESLAGFGGLCSEVEESEFERLGVVDSQSVFCELYVTLMLAALNTSRVRLGPPRHQPADMALRRYQQCHRERRRSVG